ncbi:hypothetical protein DZG02_17600, partial [Clavibacter lycopersici]
MRPVVGVAPRRSASSGRPPADRPSGAAGSVAAWPTPSPPPSPAAWPSRRRGSAGRIRPPRARVAWPR